MASNTNIGAAHPVALGTDGSVQEIPSDMEQKVLNDAAAYIRSIATSRGRNAEWGEEAVRESVSITETEALKLNVIDMIAPTLDDLLIQLNGRN
jgi:membrane-bound serine protease (ClpP class)